MHVILGTCALARMQELGNGLNINDDVMKVLFLQRMPDKIKPVLSIRDGTLTKLAEMADKMLEASGSMVATTSVAQNSEYNSLQEQIASLTAEIRRMKSPSSRSRSLSRSRRNKEEVLCWYHRKFGKNAQQCREPCSFSKN